ncbi:hypothetical protein VKT23_016128 [Stygiomarasmius scandens]|uniref:Uncharacterized protein n=1 Tax=Marasmiellus scandens TaxID=2682957 RepID=A0ABR1J0C0_9AGAR
MIGFRGRFIFVYYIFLYLLTATSAFQVQCPTSVQAGQATQCNWIRTSGDGSSFGLLLREITQDHGGTLVTTVKNTNQDQGTFQVTFPDPSQYLLEVVRNLEPVPSNEVPQILASSSTITAKSAGQGSTTGSGSGSSGSSGSGSGSQSDTSSAGGGTPDTTSSSRTSTSSSPAPPPPSPPSATSTAETQTDEEPSNTAAPSTSENSSQTQATTTSDTQSLSSSSVRTPGNLFPSPSATATSADDTSGDSGNGDTSLAAGAGSSTSPSTTNTPFPPFPYPSTNGSGATKSSSKLALIIGLTLGLLTFVLLLLALLFFLIRLRRRRATTIFYREKMGGRRLIFSNGSPEGGYGGAFASGVGAGVGGAGALVVEKSETYRNNPSTSGTTDPGPSGNRRSSVVGSRVIDATAAGAIAGYAYSVSEYSDRTSRTGSLDSKIAELWRNARGAINGLTRSRSRRTIQSGYSGYGDGNIRVDGNISDSNSNSTGTNFTFHVSEPSSSEPSVFYTAVPKPRPPSENEPVGQDMGSGIGWLKPEPPKPVTLKERLSPWFNFPFRPPPQAELPTSTIPSWHSNMSGTGTAQESEIVAKPNANTVAFPAPAPGGTSSSSTGGGLAIPASSHSGEGTSEEAFGSYESYVSLLGLPAVSSSQNHEPPVRQQPTPESFTWGSVRSSTTSSTVSYPPVSHGVMTTTFESRTSHGRSDEY